MSIIEFFIENQQKLLELVLEHLGLTFISLFIAIAIGFPLAILITRQKFLAQFILGFAGIMQTIPSIALLGFMIPFFGIGIQPAIIALFLYALLPIIRNTYTGLLEVSHTVKEAAKGMGMNDWQILTKVEIPLALPMIFAGLRTAAVINVGVATIAAYIGAGGLGEFIFGGISLNNTIMILAGAIPAALLAIILDAVLALLQKIDIQKLKKASVVLLFILPFLSTLYLIPQAMSKNLLAGFAPEFLGREDGYKGLQKTYDFSIDTLSLHSSLMYDALYHKKVDIISGYSTDGRIQAFDLFLLKDNKQFFPPYHVAPIIHKDTVYYQEIKEILSLLKIEDQTMTALNYQVDYQKQIPKTVAYNFLQQQGLIGDKTASNTTKIIIGSKPFTEQYILVEIFKLLIESHLGITVETLAGLGGTKVCFEALKNHEIDIYPEYTGTGLRVILKPEENIIKNLKEKTVIYNYVDQAFNQQYHIDWLQPLGFNNTYALMMRRKQALDLNINSISDLREYLRVN